MMVRRHAAGLRLATAVWIIAAADLAAAQTVVTDPPAAPAAAPSITPLPIAQGQPEARTEAAPDIVVTGSRIRASNLSSPSPLAVIDEQAFAATGVLQIAEAINQLPQLGAASGARSQNNNSLNSGFGFGSEFINLRNLGAQRTLVLVNSRRHVGGNPGTSSVDLNAIPAIMIERVDVVTGAASAVYGADAVSGVVNIVLKNEFEGAKITARSGISGEGDGAEFAVSGLFGGAFGDGRGHALIAGEYTESQAIDVADRFYGFADNGGTVATFATPSLANGSTAVPGGRFRASNLFFDADGVLRPLTVDDRYQRFPRKYLQNPVQRYILSTAFDYDIVTGPVSAEVYAEGSYSRSKTTFRYEPTLAQFIGGNFGTVNEAPFELPTIPANNPFLLNLPASVLARIGPIPASGLSFERRFEEFGNRFSIIDRDTFRAVVGLRGDLGPKVRYDVYYQYGRVDAQQDDQGTVAKDRVIAALNVNNNGTPSNLADDFCADVRYRNLGCVPLNVFGPNTIDRAFIDYATVPGVSNSISTQDVISGFISAEPFALPAGDVGIVVGGEYRKETVAVRPAQTFTEGSNLTKRVQGIAAEFDVKEVFGEITIPILADVPFFKRLEVGGAVRYSDYSTVGSEISWSVRGDWQVADFLRLRGTYGTAVRAPNLNELFAPRVAAISNVIDPCDTVADNGSAISLSATVQANCAAALGPLLNGFDQTQIQRQTVGNLSQGNPDLEAEKARTFTAGIALTPRGWLSGLTLTADYYHIQIRNVISQLTIGNIVDRCYNIAGLPDVFCGQVNRVAATGQLVSVNNTFLNAATETVDGIDLVGAYTLPIDPGALRLQVAWSHLFKHEFVQTAGAAIDVRDGQVGDFRNRLDIGLAYRTDDFNLAYNARYLGPALADTSRTDLGPKNDIGAVWYHDIQASYEVDDTLTLSLGVKNLFDRDPPLISGPARTSPNGEATATGIYDTRGRFFYTTLGIEF